MSIDSAKQIRKEIKKKLNLNSRSVSVQNKYCGYSSAVQCRVKIAYPLSMIDDIANNYSSIDYDERSGEILSGGNTYISTQYKYDAEIPIPNKIKDALLLAKEYYNFGSSIPKEEQLHFIYKRASEILEDWTDRDIHSLMGHGDNYKFIPESLINC